METEMLNMPEDVMIDILSWLPVTSLMRFRCVCKTWFDLIRNPDFIAKHHLNQTTLDRINLLVRHGVGDNIFSLLSSAVKDEDDGEEIPTVTESVHIPFTNSFSEYAQVFGPCNGLICLSGPNSSKISLWNPSTREFKPLPLSPIKRTKDSTFGSCGFGFDCKTNDYKVLRIVTEYLNPRRSWVNQAEIYSLKSDSWREIPTVEDLPHDIGDILCFNSYHDGHYYWRAYRGRGGLVLSFDFADEVFEVLPLPDMGEDISWNNYSWHLAIFNGCAAAVLYTWQDPEKCFDLWVMTERGVKDSWVNQARIGPISGVDRPLAFWKNGALFLKNSGGQLVLYDPRTQLLKNLQLPGPEGRLQVVTYVESLVPINGRREDEDDPFVRTRIQML